MPSMLHSSQDVLSQRPTKLLKILADSGVTLVFDSDEPHILKQEQALVVRDLTKYFQNEKATEAADFLLHLSGLCKKEKHFKKLLVPTVFKKSCDTSVVFHQDSLISVLLKVPVLQPEAMDFVLEGITTVVVEEAEDTSWLRTLLKPLRCLPNIKNTNILTKKVLDILEIATLPCQLEILDAIPEILPDSECGQIVDQLTRLLDENDDLCGAIVDCLNALNLDTEVRSHVQDRILAKMLSGTSLKIFPILLQFLLSDHRSQNLVPTLLKIRNSLDNVMQGGTSKERESCKVLIFHHLERFCLLQKTLAEGWLNAISSVKTFSDHRPIDYLIMFMLHHICEARRRVLEGIFRKRVATGLFRVAPLEKMFDKYITQQLLRNYLKNIVAVGNGLLRSSRDPGVAKFACALFEILFNHIHTSAIYRGEIISNLVSLMGVNDSAAVTTILKVISSLVLIDSQRVKIHMPSLIRLLEKLDTIDLKDVKSVFEILCSLTCGANYDDISLSGFHTEIFNLVRKQLSGWERTAKRRGVISAVVMIKHMASISGDDSFSPIVDNSITIDKIPEESPREAAKLLELVNKCSQSCPELLGLYYDQLASILASTDCFDKYFLCWLYEKITCEFQDNFISVEVPEPVNELSFSMQYLLNSPEEVDEASGINIVCQKDDRILHLAPFLRVLRLLHNRQHNSLSSIDAVLGCAVILPDFHDSDDLSSDEQVKLAVDYLFHCINWFRELISAFVTESNSLIQRRVVKRLQNLREVENKFFNCLERVPDHNLPLSYFDSGLSVCKQKVDKKTGTEKNPPRKKARTKSFVSDLNDTTINTQNKSSSAKPTPPVRKCLRQQCKFREFDTDLIRLIKYPLNLHSTSHEENIELNLDQAKIILSDFVNKLSIVTQGKDVGLSHFNYVQPEALIRDCVNIFPYLNNYFTEIVRELRTLVEKTDGRQDLPEFSTQEAKETKTCFGYILEIFLLIFQWHGFQDPTNLDLLRNLLKSMRSERSQNLTSAHRLIVEFIDTISTYSEQCLHLSHAVCLVKIMQALQSATATNLEVERKILATCESLLKRRWYNANGLLDHGKECNQNIDVLVKVFLASADLDKLYACVEALKTEVGVLQAKEDCLSMLQAIDKQNFHVFYLEICNALLDRVKDDVQALTNSEHLLLWETTAATMHGLLEIAKGQRNRTNMACFLKKAIAILKVYLSHGIPIMEIMLRSEPDEVVKIFRSIQMTTRYLHNLCCESKLTQDAGLVAHVPSFRHILESLVYRVKALLVANNCSSAFWMGPLKNRDTDGEDIISQSTVASSTRGGDVDNDQLPSDDDDDDRIILNDDEESGNNDNEASGESEVYA